MYSRCVVTSAASLQRQCIAKQARNHQLCLVRSKAAVAATAGLKDHTDVKPFHEVPGPKGFFQVAANIKDALTNSGKSHILTENKFEKYGPIFLDNVGVISILMLSDVNDIENLFRQDDKYPQRISVDSWVKWRENAKKAKGILIENDGPEWKRMRAQLDKKMMRPQHVASFTEDFNEVVTDFIARLKRIRATHGDGVRVPNLDMELFHWSLETIGTVLYERRFGGLLDDRDKEITDFINAVQSIFRTTEQIFAFPFWLAKYLAPSAYKDHVNAWVTIFATSKKLIDEKMEEIDVKLDKGEEVDGFLSTLLASKSLSQSEVYANISEVMLAAVDTASNTMQWVIYELARNPSIQEKLRQEINNVTNGAIVDNNALQKLPYLRAVVKETLRLYPIAGVVTRTLTKDMPIANYNIPSGTTVIASTYITGRNPDCFEDPLTFKPERWLRSAERMDKIHSFAWLPFGFGPRMCIGRRVAELEMHLLTARLIQNFSLEPITDEPIQIATRGLLVPEKSVDVKFIDIK